MTKDFELDPDVLDLLGNAAGSLYKDIKVDRIASGSLELDWVLGGGWPCGAVTEISGLESYGKSTMTLITIANMMHENPNAVAAYIDVEHAFDKDWAESIGVNLSRLVHFTPEDGEESFEIIRQLLRNWVDEDSGVDIIVLDSIHALSSRKRNEKEMGDDNVALEARLITDFVQKAGHHIKLANIPLLFINGFYNKIGVMYGSPLELKGGQALRYKKSVGLEMWKPEQLVGEKGTPMAGETVGHIFRYKAKKNKTAQPFREGSTPFRVWPFVGVDTAIESYNMGRMLGVLTKEDGDIIENANSTTYFNGNKVAVGRQNTIDEFYQNEDLRGEVYRAIRGVMNNA